MCDVLKEMLKLRKYIIVRYENFVAMDMQNYSRFVTYFGQFLATIDRTHPGAEEHF